VSLSRLQEVGALEQTIQGLGELADITGSKADDVRPRHVLPAYTSWWSTSQQEKIQKAQDLLIELGPILVEEGLLAK